MDEKSILFSIHPTYIPLFESGAKVFELRRVAPKIEAGTTALVYATSPVRAIVGHFQVGEVIQAPVRSLWERTGARSGVDHDSFMAYFSGKAYGAAVQARSFVGFQREISLGLMRRRFGLEPPQSYRYLEMNLTFQILGSARLEPRAPHEPCPTACEAPLRIVSA